MKRLLSILLAICLLSGCRVTKLQKVQTQAAASLVKTNVNIMLFDNSGSFLQTAAEEYTKQHPNITFSFQTLPNDSSYHGKLVKALNSATSPDAFMINGECDLSFLQDQIQPIDSLDMVEGAKESFCSQVRIGDKLYAYPLNMNGFGIIYNKDVFSFLGIDPSQMKSFSGLLQTLSALKNALPQIGFQKVLCAKSDLASIAVSNAISKSAQSVSRLSLDDNLGNVIQLLGSGNLDDPAALLANHQAVLYFGSTDILSSIAKIDPSYLQTLDIAPLPLNDMNEFQVVIGCDYLSINRYSSENAKKAIQDFLSWLYSDDSGKKVLTDNAVLTPYFEDSSIPAFKTLYDRCHRNQIRAGTLGRAPSGFAEESFIPETENLRTGKISYDTCKENIESWFEKNHTFS